MRFFLGMMLLTFTNLAVADEQNLPEFYQNFDWKLNSEDIEINKEELSDLIVGKKQLIDYSSTNKTIEIYKKKGGH